MHLIKQTKVLLLLLVIVCATGCLTIVESPERQVALQSAPMKVRMEYLPDNGQIGAIKHDNNSFIDLEVHHKGKPGPNAWCILSGFTLTILPCWESYEGETSITLSIPEISNHNEYTIKKKNTITHFVWLPMMLIAPFFSEDKYPALMETTLNDKNAEIVRDARKLQDLVDKKASKLIAYRRNPRVHPVILSRFSVYSTGFYTSNFVGGTVEVSIINNSKKTINKTEYTFVPGMFSLSSDRSKLKTLTNHETIRPGQMNRNKRMTGANSEGSSLGLGITRVKVYYTDGTSKVLGGTHLQRHGLQLPDRFVEQMK